ncbi:Acylphosphatase [groundwater metagenome]|uniref:Acylphosphatase n=1 Tax=groundwater metagenome TaxID=717931 RepID=A0A098E641_9ZZZZ
MKRVHVFVSGIVQGVGFRWFIEKNAKELNLNGFVKNIRNGERSRQVEAVFQGDEKSIDEIIKLCKKGPLFSYVRKVEVNEENRTEEFYDFEILSDI